MVKTISDSGIVVVVSWAKDGKAPAKSSKVGAKEPPKKCIVESGDLSTVARGML
jgi:hypothetical protein